MSRADDQADALRYAEAGRLAAARHAAELHRARARAHALLSILWGQFRMSPRSAYRWAGAVLGMGEVRLSDLSIEQCDRVVARVRGFLARIGGNRP